MAQVENPLDLERMKSVAQQMISSLKLMLEGKTYPVTRTSSLRLKTARFPMNGIEYQAIEQNPEKPSRWGKLAKAGHSVIQFRDLQTGKYVAVSVDGEVKPYSR